MFGSTFQTIFCPTGGDPSPIARARSDKMRVRVRALTGGTNLATEVMSLFRRSPAELAQATDSFAVPLGDVMEVILAPKEELYAMSSGPPNRVAIHRSAVLETVSPRTPETHMTSRLVMPINPALLPERPLARAPVDIPIRVTVRNLALGAGIFAPAIAVSDDASDLLDPGLENRGYQILATPTGDARDSFLLAPGQALFAVATGAVPVPISVLTYEAYVV